MAQANYTPIQLYRSTTASAVPTSGNLAAGELAINTNDGKLYYKDSGGTVQLIASKAGASGDVVGPASATDNAVVRFDGTTGKLVQNSVVTIADSTGDISGVGQLNATTVDTTNVEVTNIKAKDGTAAATIADSTGVVSITANPVLSGGTANGVLYLNGSKAATSGSALTFDGTNFSTTGTATATKLVPTGNVTAGNGMYLPATNTLAWSNNGAETMRLDSSGNLGLGVTPSAWTTTFGLKAMQVYGSALASNGTSGYLTNNAYYATASYTPTYIAASSTPAQAITFNRTGANDIQFLVAPSGTAGNAITFTQAMTLDSSGNLGIGTSSPISNSGYGGLSLNGTSGALFSLMTNGTESSRIASIGDVTSIQCKASTGYITFVQGVSGGTERMRLDSSGNLGLGVTPSAWVGKAIEIGPAANGFLFNDSNNVNLGANAYYNAGWKYQTSSVGASRYAQTSGAHVWYNAASGTAGNAITFTQAMTLDASGNLGIGSTSPSTNLVIGGTASGAGSAGSLGVFLSRGVTTNFYEAYDGTKSMIAGVDSNQSFIKIGAFSNHPLAFVTNNGERARITSGGDLLVGTTSVPSSSSGGAAFVPSSVGRTLLKLGTTTTSGAGLVEFYNPNGMIGEISVNGSTTTYSTSSDYRLKNTIAPMTGALAKVALLKPCTYKWNVDGSDGEGFIAHELAEVVPQCVTGEKDGVDAEGKPVYQGVDTSFLVATLTAAIQEQQALITSLTARVALLEGN